MNNTLDELQDTIAALSTPYGVGAIAVVRMSGSRTLTIAAQVTGKSLTRPVQVARIADLDDVVVTVFRAPHSFTGEDMVEIGCHGSLYVQRELLRRLVDAGCRPARAGEFTRRAFLNGKMDLSQAEAVADLIAAESKAEQQLALGQLRGSLSGEIAHMRQQLLDFTSLIELELDFADHEDITFVDRDRLKYLANSIEEQLEHLTGSFVSGNAIKNGIAVAIVGAPNAGKSTLLNSLLGEDRAIVSEQQGTTRDTIEDTLFLGGYRFRLIDTAGIRDTQDPIEQMGVERSRQAIHRARIVVEVVDATCPLRLPLTLDEGQTHLLTYNKTDLLPTDQLPKDGPVIAARLGQIEPLRQALIARAEQLVSLSDGTAVSNLRHYEAFSRALNAIRMVKNGLELQVSGEFIATDLHDCLNALGEVTGQITSDEVLGNIFSKFCIGK